MGGGERGGKIRKDAFSRKGIEEKNVLKSRLEEWGQKEKVILAVRDKVGGKKKKRVSTGKRRREPHHANRCVRKARAPNTNAKRKEHQKKKA